jgi:cytochrome c-type biogenesis protein CcmH
VIGWLLPLALLAACLGALRLLGIRGPMLQLAAAALLLGAAGYALQGRPGLAGAPQRAADKAPPPSFAPLRHAFFGRFTGVEHWLLIADSFRARGRTADAVGVLRSALRQYPGSLPLWIGLGNALVDHAGTLTPAAELAYRRAAELAPGHPAPSFFYGLALARSGDRAGAVQLWTATLAAAPADASWRPLVEDALAAIRGAPGPQEQR